MVANSTPEVPSEPKESPGRIAPRPTAPAALSPAPPASTARPMPQRAASSARRMPAGALPSTSRGMAARDSPVAARAPSDQSRAATSSQSVPDASDISSISSPVSW